MLKPIAKVFVALNGNLRKEQIAAGFSWGLLLGLVPTGNAFWIGAFMVSFFFRHHHGSKLLVMAIFKLISAAVAPLVDLAGWEVLHIEALQGLYTTMYNMPFVPLTRFNNTLVAGGIAVGLVLWLPVFFVMRQVVPLYRNTISPWIKDLAIVKAVKQLPLVAKLGTLAAKIADKMGSYDL